MDYVVGSVAALISGNVTPNRPKLVRRALTPIKHQPSPNVTPKSELVDDRSIFLSPTSQKKKAIIKKSPKRIFQNPDLDVTSENENNSNPPSPKADKVKKHLTEELEADNKTANMAKTPKKKRNKDASPAKHPPEMESPQSANENTPKKQKKRKLSEETNQINKDISNSQVEKTSQKNKKVSESENSVPEGKEDQEVKNDQSPKKKKKKKSKAQKYIANKEADKANDENQANQSNETVNVTTQKKKNKKRKNKKGKNNQLTEKMEIQNQDQNQNEDQEATSEKPMKAKNKKDDNYVNPNAITDKDTDSEHESDDEIVSENEEANKEVLDTGPAEDSSDEEKEDDVPKKKETKEPSENTSDPRSEDENNRTIFVGNVPFSKKCKKEIKKIFKKHGDIETVRIRTIPVKDGRVTPKLAVIKNELHPERTTVNVYVKFKDPSSVEKALVENNTVLSERHLRVTRSASAGAEHDPRRAVFVGNVPFAMEDDALRDKFAKCGDIESVRIVRDRKTNAGKGFAYVNFASKDGVELALALSEEDLTIKNRILRVKRCTQGTNKQKNSGPQKSFQGKKFPDRNQGGRNVQNKQPFGKKGGSFQPRQGQNSEEGGEGAYRRIMNKRKNQDGSEGPPNKRQNLNQPHKEKKVRKEFVGMTAEKKKKHKFNKGQKKKKALSEILSKYT